MKKGQRDSGSFGRRGKTSFLPDDSFLFEDELEVRGLTTATVITSTVWLVEILQLSAGRVSLLRGKKLLVPRSSVFGIFYPPFGIAQVRFEETRARVIGIAGRQSFVAQFATVPLLFTIDCAAALSGRQGAEEILKNARDPQPVEINPQASALSSRAKRQIDQNYLGEASIAGIAAKLRVRPEHLSRQFKRDFGLSPREYLHRLRLADAPLRLAQNQDIIRVAQDSGYNDLSRFYRQFRKSTHSSPGACRAMLKPKPRRVRE